MSKVTPPYCLELSPTPGQQYKLHTTNFSSAHLALGPLPPRTITAEAVLNFPSVVEADRHACEMYSKPEKKHSPAMAMDVGISYLQVKDLPRAHEILAKEVANC